MYPLLNSDESWLCAFMYCFRNNRASSIFRNPCFKHKWFRSSFSVIVMHIHSTIPKLIFTPKCRFILVVLHISNVEVTFFFIFLIVCVYVHGILPDISFALWQPFCCNEMSFGELTFINSHKTFYFVSSVWLLVTWLKSTSSIHSPSFVTDQSLKNKIAKLIFQAWVLCQLKQALQKKNKNK